MNSFGYLYPQTVISDYYITQDNDTIPVTVQFKKGLFGQITNDFIKEVIVIESNKDSKKFGPEDINGYGFTYQDVNYSYVSKPTKNGSKKFLVPVVLGPKTSLYQYTIFSTGGAINNKKVFYTFEKNDNTYLFLSNTISKKSQLQLKEFYKENPEVGELIDTKLKYWLEIDEDLREILATFNNS